MSNHYHIALRTAEVPLWRSMASIQGLATKGFNRRHRVYGPLWQGRYRARFVEDDVHLRQLLAYIHLNPVSAGLVDELAGRRREPRLRELHELVAVLGVEKYGQRVCDIAESLQKNPGSISRWVTTSAERRLSDSGFARRLRKLDEAVRSEGSSRKSNEL